MNELADHNATFKDDMTDEEFIAWVDKYVEIMNKYNSFTGETE
jgi:hypothetical protein